MVGTLSGGDLLYLASFVLVPLVAFWLAVRAGRTRAQILLVATLTGLLPGSLLPVQVVLAGESLALAGAMAGWAVFTALVGAGVGVVGLLLLECRQWFAERPGGDAV